MFKSVIATLAILGTAAAADITAPPWAARGTGPTSKLEVVTYAAQVRPLLPDDIRAKLDAASNAAPAEIVGLLYEARLRPAVTRSTTSTLGITNAPQPIAPTNNPVADALLRVKPYTLQTGSTSLWAELEKTAKTYESQWQIFYGTNTQAMFGPDQLDQLNRAAVLFQELNARIADANDQLDNLDNYELVHRIPGASMNLFWKMETLYYRIDKVRAENLIKFFFNKENKDGFTIGGAYYYQGRACFEWHDDILKFSNAFVHVVRAHQYPACLTYIAHSYVQAAYFLRFIQRYKHAKALLVIDVPSGDFAELRRRRFIDLADLCELEGDITNAVRHLQSALLTGTDLVDCIASRRERYPIALWDAMVTNIWRTEEGEDYIAQAFASTIKTPDDSLFLDAVLHEWPKVEAIPNGLATNIVLYNNVFPQTRKTKPTNLSAKKGGAR